MKITHLYAENCFGIKKLDTEMYSRTEITGANGSGKSTVANIIRWILFNKLADGSEVTGIRPHDENGVDVDFVDIIGILDVDVDGIPYQFKKVQRQKWVKKRGSEEKRFEGNVTEYEINGIPKREADYNAFIYSLADQDAILYGMNGQAVLMLESKKRREKLLSLESGFTDADVIASDPERFGFLERELRVGTLDELITRSKKVLKEKKKALDAIPTRIDEVQKMRADVDLSPMEAEVARGKEDLDTWAALISDMESGIANYDEVSSRIMQLRLDKNGLIAELNKDNSERRAKLNSDIADERHACSMKVAEVERIRKDITKAESLITGLVAMIADTRKRVDAAKAQTFDEHKLTCPTCGQQYTAEQQSKIRSKFETEKKRAVDELCKAGNEYLADKKAATEDVTKRKATLESLEQDIKAHKDKIVSLEAELNGIPTSVDISENPKVKEFDEKIAQAEAELQGIKNIKEKIGEVRTQARSTERRIEDAQNRIAAIKAGNESIAKRVEELTEEQKATSQMVLDQEKMLDTLEAFNRARINMLTERINKHFSLVQWVMFRQQINGGWQAVCEPMVNGTSYFGTLNQSSKLLAEMDIAVAFQNKAGKNLPVFLDNAEGVDPDRRMDFGRQLIMMVRTDDKELKVSKA